MNQTKPLSPMMQQWYDLKNQQKDALLLFRLGDFYEAFYDDAKVLSDVLDITLTKRQEVPMSGIPYHSSSGYLDILLQRGYKIAMAEQVENPKDVKGLVRREVVRILSPGANLGTTISDDKKHHFIALLGFKKGLFCLAWLDISLNAAYFQEEESFSSIIDLISLIGPKELLIDDSANSFFNTNKILLPSSILYKETVELDFSNLSFYENMIKEHFKSYSLNSLGIKSDISALTLGKLLHLLKNDRLYDLKNIAHVFYNQKSKYLMIDKSTQSHLELFDKKEGKFDQLTLFNFLNQTLTTSGSRLFENWLKFPLTDSNDILNRQQSIKYLSTWEKKALLVENLKKIKDIQKIISKINLGTVNAQDLKNLQRSLEAATNIKALAEDSFPTILKEAFHKLETHDILIKLLERSIIDTPSPRLHEGPTFKKGFSQELDELLLLTESQDEFLKAYELKLKEETGIKTLKVGVSKNFGFYIEISKGQASFAPSHFIRRQTLTNQERFITDELAKFEKKAQAAKTELSLIESSLFDRLLNEVLSFSLSLLETQESLSRLDVLQSLAKIALKQGYTCPEISDNHELVIKESRHPIIEELIPNNMFVPNDLELEEQGKFFMLITGPNMGGKSTYMRQAALCVIMAQIGSYVPASYMKFSPCDRLFTRIGASDDLASGQSTFMVEMAETAYILKNATKNSLVILDEIGRGTSTYDGIAIAYAIAKYLLDHPRGLPKTLFATHYFELTDLENEDSRISNFHAGVKDEHGDLVFLHKIIKGPADKSYGIQVAKLAGLPDKVIELSIQKLRCLLDPDYKNKTPSVLWSEPKIPEHPLTTELSHLKIDNLTPLEALNTLSVWKKMYST